MKYTVNNVPASGAFMPVLSAVVSTRAWNYGLVKIVGHPGDQAIPSPKPSALPAGPLMRSAQPSYNSPDVFYPSIYYTHIQDMGPDVRWVSTNEVPMPAKRITNKPGIAYRPARYGGLRQVSWPPAPQVWQNINQGAVSG